MAGRVGDWVGFTVTGAWQQGFPLDMLRCDGAWAARVEDSWRLAQMLNPADHGPPETARVTLRLRAMHPPSLRRWAAFGWEVRLE